MKAILLPIRPEHLVNILNGHKTLEVRTYQLPLDIPVYLYCSKSKPYLWYTYEEPFFDIDYTGEVKDYALNGYVVAKCVFSGQTDLNYWELKSFYDHTELDYEILNLMNDSCLSVDDLWERVKPKKDAKIKKGEHFISGKDLHFYHITNLELLDKKLSDFGKNRAPQKFAYVEVEDE